MTILIGYSESSIRNEASKLFKILNNSKKLKSVVNKNNLVNILQMYKNDTQINNNIHHNKLVYFIDNELKKQTESSIKQYTLIIESTLDELDMPKIKKLIDCLNETSKDLSIRIIKRE
jgi:hypothetical protein